MYYLGMIYLGEKYYIRMINIKFRGVVFFGGGGWKMSFRGVVKVEFIVLVMFIF